MTSFLTGGMGGMNSQSSSKETQVLRDIDSRKLSYANKDFTKNISWLNQSVDTLSAYTQKLQSGVDQANANAIEQIQGIFGDLFILFAGGTPTGIEIGDVKYVIQGIGAFFGINPDTPFPMNLLEAAEHILTNFIIPLPQFTDVVFDAILAWAEDFGLSPEFITSLTELKDAIEGLGASFDDLFAALSELLGAFGFLDFTSTSGLGELWDALIGLIDGIPLEALKPVLELLTTLGVPFINALAAIVNGGSTFLGFISGDQVRSLGDNIAPANSADTTVWSVGGSSTTAWVYDAATNASGSAAGSLTTLGTGVAKRVATQATFPCTPGSKLMVNAKLRWSGIPTGATDFGVALVFFNGATEISQSNVNIATGHGATGGFTALTATEITVPASVDGFKIASRVGSGISTGQVWTDDVTVQRSGAIDQSIITGLTDALASLLPLDFFDDIIGGTATPANLLEYFTSFLTGDSPLDLGNAFGWLNPASIPFVDLSSIGQSSPNLLVNPTFDNEESIDGEGLWFWDDTEGYSDPGSVRVLADGVVKELVSNDIPVSQDQKVNIHMRVKWTGLVFTGTPFSVDVAAYNGDTLVSTTVLGTPNAPATNSSPEWQEIGGTYTVPAGVTMVRVRLYVNNTATAGTIWFDDGNLNKSNLLSQGYTDGLLGDISDIFDGLGLKLPIGDFDDLIDALTGGLPSTLASIIARFSNISSGGFFDITKIFGTLPTGNIPVLDETHVPGLTDIVDFFTGGILGAAGGSGNPLSAIGTVASSLMDFLRQGADGTSQTSSTAPDVYQGINGMRDSISSAQNLLAQIQSGQDAGPGVVGNAFQDEGERVSSSGWGASWALSGPAAAVGIDGHNFHWIDSGSSVRSVLGRFVDGFTLGDIQSVGFVFNSLMEGPQAFTGQGPAANNILIGRCDASMASMVVVQMYYNKIILGYLTGGVYHQFPHTPGSNPSQLNLSPPSSGRWSLDLGTDADPYEIAVKVNGAKVLVYHDTGHLHTVGASNRYGGMGMQSDSRSSGEATPGSIQGWTLSDNAQMGVVGTTFKATRRVTTDTSLASGTNEIPNNFFETVDRISGDLTYEPGSNCRLKVTKEGTYLVSICVFHGQYSSSNFGRAVVYLNGSLDSVGRWAGNQLNLGFSLNTTLEDTTGDSFQVYCEAGDYITPGMSFTSGMSDTGSTDLSGGAITYFTVSKINPY